MAVSNLGKCWPGEPLRVKEGVPNVDASGELIKDPEVEMRVHLARQWKH